MANPQQPELRRSEQIPSITPDAMEGELEARRDDPTLSEEDPVDPAWTDGAAPHGQADDGQSPEDKPADDKLADVSDIADS